MSVDVDFIIASRSELEAYCVGWKTPRRLAKPRRRRVVNPFFPRREQVVFVEYEDPECPPGTPERYAFYGVFLSGVTIGRAGATEDLLAELSRATGGAGSDRLVPPIQGPQGSPLFALPEGLADALLTPEGRAKAHAATRGGVLATADFIDGLIADVELAHRLDRELFLLIDVDACAPTPRDVVDAFVASARKGPEKKLATRIAKALESGFGPDAEAEMLALLGEEAPSKNAARAVVPLAAIGVAHPEALRVLAAVARDAERTEHPDPVRRAFARALPFLGEALGTSATAPLALDVVTRLGPDRALASAFVTRAMEARRGDRSLLVRARDALGGAVIAPRPAARLNDVLDGAFSEKVDALRASEGLTLATRALELATSPEQAASVGGAMLHARFGERLATRDAKTGEPAVWMEKDAGAPRVTKVVWAGLLQWPSQGFRVEGPLVEAALDATLEEGRFTLLPPPIERASLADDDRAWLTLLHGADAFFARPHDWLAAYGLPRDRASLGALLGVPRVLGRAPAPPRIDPLLAIVPHALDDEALDVAHALRDYLEHAVRVRTYVASPYTGSPTVRVDGTLDASSLMRRSPGLEADWAMTITSARLGDDPFIRFGRFDENGQGVFSVGELAEASPEPTMEPSMERTLARVLRVVTQAVLFALRFSPCPNRECLLAPTRHYPKRLDFEVRNALYGPWPSVDDARLGLCNVCLEYVADRRRVPVAAHRDEIVRKLRGLRLIEDAASFASIAGLSGDDHT